MNDPSDLVTKSLDDGTSIEFNDRVRSQANELLSDYHRGRLDNPTYAVGIELEVYAVDSEFRLTKVPKSIFSDTCDKELGMHNAEFQTAPSLFDDYGIEEQATQLAERYRTAQTAARSMGLTIVLDAMWTIPPVETTSGYLSDVDGDSRVILAQNMTPSPRYHAIDNEIVSNAGGSIALSVPGVEREFPSILLESLTSSIQPHFQIPSVEEFPRYHNLAVRTLGPVLALATNSPLLPIDLYEIDDPYRLLEDTQHELRIAVFEQAINGAWEKVRFPTDIMAVPEVLYELVEDPTCAPFLREWVTDSDRQNFADRYWELDHKRGTYWRWLRGVIGGQPVGGGDEWSIRLEYRPIPTQPTINDNIGFLCLVSGLLRGLAERDHPLEELDHSAAKTNFYNAVSSGIDGEMMWITEGGERTTDRRDIYPELFDLARRGLESHSISSSTIDRYFEPLTVRWEKAKTPSQWKLDRVRDALDDGDEFFDAVARMQREYIARSCDEKPFSTWIS